jgi:hypothetical protein
MAIGRAQGTMLHLGEEFLAPRALILHRVLGAGKKLRWLMVVLTSSAFDQQRITRPLRGRDAEQISVSLADFARSVELPASDEGELADRTADQCQRKDA